MAHVSQKLTSAFQGALAGGGDPATSPLYIFGPFLRLIVVAGVAQVTFGASLWLVVLTIATVSAMYRLVMTWVTDGSGGSGLAEEEFGSWAVKVNAGITFVEYTLTFLVSMAALVTFLADRFAFLNDTFLFWQYRTYVAILLSLATGYLVNRGPRMAAYTFGPATGAVLLLLWVMVGATIWRYGLELPKIDWRAFNSEYIGFTVGGFARILAVMTGIEVFANLVAAYEGPPKEKSRKAFGSLLIIMGTTSITMVVVGPVILRLSDPTNLQQSVFTQTMDQLLPAPLAYAGTLVGIAVLLSAAAASAQGLQNLAVGLRYRHYVPFILGRWNRHGVADMPVWLEIGVVVICFLLFGTHEETYLAIYAAGVFVLLSMTGWAAAKRLWRQLQAGFSLNGVLLFFGTILAATLTTVATSVIFQERFLEGAWTYFLFLPALYVVFSYFRNRLGEPSAIEDRLGKLISSNSALPTPHMGRWIEQSALIQHVLVPVDGSENSTLAVPVAASISHKFQASISLFQVANGEMSDHMQNLAQQLRGREIIVRTQMARGPVAANIWQAAQNGAADLIVMSTRGQSGVKRLLLGSVASEVIQKSTKPIMLVRSQFDLTSFKRILVPLDGSDLSERILPYALAVGRQYASEVIFLHAPEAKNTPRFNEQMQRYLGGVTAAFMAQGVTANHCLVEQAPVVAIVATSVSERADLIMLATSGRGGVARALLGSVADAVVRQAACPVFLTPVHVVQMEGKPGSRRRSVRGG